MTNEATNFSKQELTKVIVESALDGAALLDSYYGEENEGEYERNLVTLQAAYAFELMISLDEEEIDTVLNNTVACIREFLALYRDKDIAKVLSGVGEMQ